MKFPVLHGCVKHYELKVSGVLPWTDQELLEQVLDKAHPDARSRQVVEYKGKRYEKRWIPTERSNSGLPKRWKGYWVELTDIAAHLEL